MSWCSQDISWFRRVSVVVAVLVLGLGACSSDDADEVSTSNDDTATTEVAPAVPAGWTGVPAPDPSVAGLMTATPDGTLWVGSLGLYRWDGEDWTRITYEQGLSASPGFDPDAEPPDGGPCGVDNQSPGVSELAAGSDGMLWLVVGDCAGDTGLVSYDGEAFTTYGRPPASRPTRDIGGEGLYVDGSGAVWLYLTDYEIPEAVADPADPEMFTGAARLAEDGEWTVYPLEESLEVMNHGFVVGRDGTAWFAGTEGVWRLDGDTWTTVDTAPVDEAGSLVAAAAGPEGDLWVSILPDGGGDVTGFGHWVDGAWEIHDATAGLEGLDTWQFTVAPDGTLWIAATPTAALEGQGLDFADPTRSLVLVSFDGTAFVDHRPDEVTGEVALNVPYSITTDGTSIWVGSLPGDGDFVRFTPG